MSLGRNQKQRIQALEALEASVHSQNVSPISPDLIFATAPETGFMSHAGMPVPDELWMPVDGMNFDAGSRTSPPPDVRQSSTTGQTSLHRAVCSENESMVRILLDRGADISRKDANGNTALHLAAANKYGSEALVKLLLDESADSNAQDHLGQTALFAAVQNGNEEAVKLLLDSSVDINSKDSMGNVALHYAVEDGAESMVLLLLSHGADIDA